MRSIVQMGKELAIVMVVEGVENRKHHEFLREAGVFFGQGYFYRRPMEKEAFLMLLTHG
ncbi:MAG: EAL domain-containing protein [Sphaerochaeta sp.]|uniref:EAL domain-containing protein n=1 Tax=Sphaerochaeta sp. TaxID=1972642 RepID=UPI003D10884F